jgi:hypothetical protein
MKPHAGSFAVKIIPQFEPIARFRVNGLAGGKPPG